MNPLVRRRVMRPASVVIVLVSTCAALVACSSDDDPSGEQAGSGGQSGGAGAGGGASGAAGKATGGQAGSGGQAAGSGGQAAGSGGQAAGAAGAAGQAGAAGASAGQAGAAGQAGGAGAGGGKVVPLFVAQGHLGRTTVSCDDGQTWVADQSENDAQRCWADDNYDCDHKSNSGTGLAFGGGYFYTSMGWGEPGPLRRSPDGATWEVLLDKISFAGLAYAGGTLVAGGQSPRWSTDGATWSEPVPTSLPGHARKLAAGTLGGAPAFAMVGDGPSGTVSTDGGKTWVKPESFPAFNENEYWTGLAIGGDVVVAVTSPGRVFRTTDGGKSWTVAAETGVGLDSTLIWTGTEFVTWASGKRLRSADGASWETADSDLPFGPGAAARGASGTYVMVKGGWQVWYEKQQFARSEDGVHWTVLPDGAYKKSHPIRSITVGEGVCPAK